jgi:hypothetical protein
MDSLGNISNINGAGASYLPPKTAVSAKAEISAPINDSVLLTGTQPADDMKKLSGQAIRNSSDTAALTEAASVTSEKTNVYGTINGWIGKNSANLTVNQIHDNINADGWVGSASVHLNERKFGGGSAISGNIHTVTEGFKSVNLNVSGNEGMRTLNGWIGKDNVILRENKGFQGETEVTGRIGSKDIDVRFSNQNGRLSIEGNVRDSMSFGSERIWLSGNQNPSEPGMGTLCIIPALTIIDK